MSFDFTLASLTLGGPATGLRVTATGATRFQYVAAAALCNVPRHIFVVVVSRLPRGSTALTPVSITLRVEASNAEPALAIAQHVNILADGAPGRHTRPRREPDPNQRGRNYSMG
jgi:hypothetical protein